LTGSYPVNLRTAAILWFGLAVAPPAQAQAWLPAAGEGYVSLSYLDMYTSDHLLSSGQAQDRGPAQINTITAGILYGITDRLAASAEVPYILSKFTLTPGLAPNAHDLESKIDDGRYHGTFQDFRGAVKYNLLHGPLMFTPSIEVVIPTHTYQTFGHSAPGKDLRELHVVGEIGRLLNPILPRAYFDLRYSYSFVQHLVGFDLDRHNVDLEVGYFVKSWLTVRGLGAVQKTVGGVESLVPPDSPYFPIHDRLERGHYSRTGGGFTISPRGNLDVWVLVVSTLSGKNIQAFTAPIFGVTWNFHRRRGAQKTTRDLMLRPESAALSAVLTRPRD
jgi:hypothetical protein